MEDMRQAGLEASSEVIQFKPVTVEDKVAAMLNVDFNQKDLRLDCLRR